mgnify:CR=1 FL=1
MIDFAKEEGEERARVILKKDLEGVFEIPTQVTEIMEFNSNIYCSLTLGSKKATFEFTVPT